MERSDPDLWTDEFTFLSEPGQAQIQSDLFYDYRSNVEAYPKWKAWMREKQPRLLVLWENTSPRSTPRSRKPIAGTDLHEPRVASSENRDGTPVAMVSNGD